MALTAYKLLTTERRELHEAAMAAEVPFVSQQEGELFSFVEDSGASCMEKTWMERRAPGVVDGDQV